jgi:cytidine deaminase
VAVDAATRRALVRAALRARRRAYAPYSNFKVGAALLTRQGTTFSGCNVENASYGLCICAERVAVTKALSEGRKDFIALAVATQSSPPSPPCGLCLQTLVEFSSDLPLLLVNPNGESVETSLSALFPGAFTRALLES